MATNGKKEEDPDQHSDTEQQLPLACHHVARETSETISSTVQKDLPQIQQVRNMAENGKGFLQAH